MTRSNLRCRLGFHRWKGCQCVRCRRTRETGHDWRSNCEKCLRCGAPSGAAHVWGPHCQCANCRQRLPHQWEPVPGQREGVEACARCGDLWRPDDKCPECHGSGWLWVTTSSEYVPSPDGRTGHLIPTAGFGKQCACCGGSGLRPR